MTFFIAVAYLVAMLAFTVIYVGICTNIVSIADDISMNIDRLNGIIGRKISIKDELKQFMGLHLHCYK